MKPQIQTIILIKPKLTTQEKREINRSTCMQKDTYKNVYLRMYVRMNHT